MVSMRTTNRQPERTKIKIGNLFISLLARRTNAYKIHTDSITHGTQTHARLLLLISFLLLLLQKQLNLDDYGRAGGGETVRGVTRHVVTQ